MPLTPPTLETEWLRLEPLSPRHQSGLAAAIRDGELWTIRETLVPHPDDLSDFFEAAVNAMWDGREIPFAVVDRARDAVVGSTRFMVIHENFRRLEIGYTFYAAAAQRTHVNTNAKYLMLRHAFEHWQMNRVELLTDARNTRSRAAIERIGAVQEGVLRSHMLMPDGHVRDSVLFAMVREDWPEAKASLERRLAPAGA